jgi:hypothetical protein
MAARDSDRLSVLALDGSTGRSAHRPVTGVRREMIVAAGVWGDL